MIGKLRGIIDSINDNKAIIDINGVGYVVFCSAKSLSNFPAQGEEVILFIETHVREDHIHLFGFLSQSEQDAFIALQKVNGVGAKMALSILSSLSPEELSNAILAEDKAPFKAVSGVGPKLASRLITELKDTFGVGFSIEVPGLKASNTKAPVNTLTQDAITALVTLGYSRTEAYQAINKASAENDNLPLEQLIRAGLKELST